MTVVQRTVGWRSDRHHQLFTLKAEIGKGEAGRTDSMIATIVNRAVTSAGLSCC
jgi:hypothetical protein